MSTLRGTGHLGGEPPQGPLLRRAGYPDSLIEAQRAGYVSVEPVATSGRFVVANGLVMFVTQQVNHAVALAQSGLPATSGTTVGYYSARQLGEPWIFISVDAWAFGGNRVAPSAAAIKAAKQAFLDSGYGDMSRALRGI